MQPQNPMALIALIPGHVVLKTSPTIRGDQIHLISADALDGHWVPLARRNGTGAFTYVSLDKIPKRSTFSDSDAALWQVSEMAVYASPLRDDTYRVWILALPSVSSMRNLSCYELVTAPDQQPCWGKRIRYFDNPYSYDHIFYSGHTMTHVHEQHRIFPPTETRDYEELELADCGDRISTTPYSGAVTYATRTCVVITYFK